MKGIRIFRDLVIILGMTIFIARSEQLFSQGITCSIKNNSFESEEVIKFVVSYKWLFLRAEMGEVTLTVRESEIFNKPCYHLDGVAKSFRTWDWFFKVRDHYQSWVDPVSLKPYYFERDVYEGGFFMDIDYVFERNNNIAFTSVEKTDVPLFKDTLQITSCTYDVMSIVYCARNIDYSANNISDTIPITILLDNELTNIYFRYIGKEKIKIRRIGTFNCIKFGVYLVEGSIFHEGENMELWVTDDENKIPVLVKTPILIGAIQARIVGLKGYKYKLTSKIK